MEKKTIKIRDKKAIALNIFSACFGFVILLMLVSFIFRITYPQQLQSKPTSNVELVIPAPPMQISIMNACGVDGMAKKLKSFLNQNKYNVVSIGNLTSVAEKSYIKCSFTDSKTLGLASELGIDESMLKSSQNNVQNQSITIVIGKDYSLLKPFKSK
ncbi:MAG: LytR family transcriptional regulator [Bacteroidetes bacterium]|nr:MAG: LytR family transcriptional regulator [Bacteroidota bacterium]